MVSLNRKFTWKENEIIIFDPVLLLLNKKYIFLLKETYYAPFYNM